MKSNEFLRNLCFQGKDNWVDIALPLTSERLLTGPACELRSSGRLLKMALIDLERNRKGKEENHRMKWISNLRIIN